MQQNYSPEFRYRIVILPLYNFDLNYNYMYIFQNNDLVGLNDKLKSTYTHEYTKPLQLTGKSNFLDNKVLGLIYGYYF